MMDILKDKWVTTKKAHKCLCCHRSFPVGSRMKYQVNNYQGEFQAHYCCERCLDLVMDKNSDQFWNEGAYEDGCTREYLIENGEINPESQEV